MKTLKLITLQSFILALLFTLLTACGKTEESASTVKPLAVKVEKVKTEEISIPVISSGKLTSSAETKLSFKTGGIIEKIFAEEGAFVKKGDMLAKLNLSEINSQVRQAKEAYNKSERDLERVENLYKDSVATLEQFQNTRTAMELAKSNLNMAEFNLNHSTIIAPSSGKILKRFNEEGEITGPGIPVFLFGDNNKGWIIRIGVTDRDVVKLSIGDNAEIFIDAYPEKVFNANVSEIGSSANPYNGTFEVELTLAQPDEKLVSGFIAKVKIYPSYKSLLYTIPVEALFEANGKEGIVFTYNSGSNTAQKTKIIIEELLPKIIAVKSGITEKDLVVTEGVEYLTAGRQVVIK